MTAEQIYALPINKYGWRTMSNRIAVRLGRNVRVHNSVTLGNCVTLGNNVVLRNNVTLDDDVTLGNYVCLDEGVRLGKGVSLGNNIILGKNVMLGDNVKIGDGVRIADNTTLLSTPLAVQGTRHLATNVGPGVIQIGCQTHSFEHWTEYVLQIADDNNYTPEQGLEYQRIVAFIVAFIVANGIPAMEKVTA